MVDWMHRACLKQCYVSNIVRYTLLMMVLTAGLSGEVASTIPDLPPNRDVLAFLTGTIDWYRQRAIERQIASDAADLMFVQDNRAIALQIVRRSFDFARADAAAAAMFEHNQKQSTASVSNSSQDMAQFVVWQSNTEMASRKANQEIEDIREKLLVARGADHRNLQAALEAAQSRLVVLQAGAATLEQLVQFVREFGDHGTGDLASATEELVRTVPEVMNTTFAPPQLQTSEAGSVVKPSGSGILSLSTEASALGRKLHILDDEIRRTDALRQSSDALRNPLLASISRRFADDTQGSLQGSDLTQMQEQKARLDALASTVKTMSPAILALNEQRVLLDAYSSQLKSWRSAVIAKNEKTWKELALRSGAVVAIIGALLVIGTLARRWTRRHVLDQERRHRLLVVERVGVWFIIVIIAVFAFASDLSSVATFFGLLTAGIAVALQSVILCAAGYFVLVGRRGIRLGDRVQISSFTGNVTDIGWLQFQVTEIDTRTQEPTGNVVTFSNSFVFSSPAAGLSKFSQEGKPTQLESVAKSQA